MKLFTDCSFWSFLHEEKRSAVTSLAWHSRGNSINISLRNGRPNRQARRSLIKHQTGPQTRLKTRQPCLRQATEDGPLRVISTHWIINRAHKKACSLKCVCERDRDEVINQQMANDSDRQTKRKQGWRNDTYSCTRGKMSTNLPADVTSSTVSSKCSILCYMCLSLQTICLSVVIAWDVGLQRWAH